MSIAAIRNALVLSPHPDDESLGCGGTVKLITAAGGQVDVLYLTRGELGLVDGAPPDGSASQDLAARRMSEAESACRCLGVRAIGFLNGRDGHLHSQPELAGDILRALYAVDYGSVFCPWPRDAHADHMATYGLLREALGQYPRDIDVWLYEVWTPLVGPNMTIAIDGTIDAKMRAIAAHQSQAAALDYARAFHALAQYRSLSCAPAKFAEAFFNCDRHSLLRDEDLPWLMPRSGGCQHMLR